MQDPLEHLLAHHGDFAAFRDAMIQSSAGRFGPMWWGFWEQYAAPLQPTTVVDLGTGPGLLLPMLRARCPNARLIGVEVQPEMLGPAAENAAAAQAELLRADLNRALPLPDEVADVVIAVMVLHELPFPPTLLAEARRLLRPGGRMLIYDWVKQPLREYLGDRALTPALLDHFREHCLFSPDDLVSLCGAAGLHPLEVVGRRGGAYAMLAVERPG